MMVNRARLFQWQLARAREVDESLRERAFLCVPGNINGVTVNQFTLRHLTILSHLQSPFIYGGARRAEDVGVFLWVISPHYDTLPAAESNRARYLAELVLHPHWDRFYRGIDRYIYHVYRDAPPTVKSGKTIATCYAAGVIHKISKNYGWDDEAIMNKPLIRLFQYLKWIQVEEHPSTPQFNPLQDKISNRF